jgi:hypothetical protein
VNVDEDLIAVVDKSDRTAIDRLGRYVADTESPRATAEPAVGDQCAVGAAARSAPVIASISRIPGPPFGPS